MKKLLAMSGAATLGAAGLAVAATPAEAAPALPACDSIDNHDFRSAEPGSDWYMDCVPQYGWRSKAEADLDFISANAIPDGFDPNAATVTTDLDDAGASGYIGREVTSGFTTGFSAVDPQPPPNEHRYGANPVFQIADVSAIDPSTLPAECPESYNAAYRVDYVPRAITFSQEIDGTTYTYRGSVRVDPLLLGMNLPYTGVDDFDACAAIGSTVATEFPAIQLLRSLSPLELSDSRVTSPFLPLYTVDFDAKGGSAVKPSEVLEGDAATAPDDPTREGYSFVGWFTEPDGGTAWDLTAPVMSNTTLYAQWSLNSYTVSFDSQEGSPVDDATVDHGDAATSPDGPAREGHTFAGWFTEPAGGELWDFATPITADTTLYAQWEEVPADESEQPEQSHHPEQPEQSEQPQPPEQTEQTEQPQQSEKPQQSEQTEPAEHTTESAAPTASTTPTTQTTQTTQSDQTEELSATGFDAGPWSLAGLGLLILGAGAVLFPWMRRRSSGRLGRGAA